MSNPRSAAAPPACARIAPSLPLPPPIGARRSALGRVALGVLAAFAIAGCYERRLAPAVPCTSSSIEQRIEAVGVDSVDLLLLVDNSNSMAGEQALLGLELPRMIRVLASGDLDEDGREDFTPLRSLHVGVVTSDLGAGPLLPPGESVPSCAPGLGDDGVLRTLGASGTSGCAASYPSPFDFGAGDDPDAFARDVACVAVMGTGGCAFEQQLEAALKAVSASSAAADYVPAGYVPPVFAGGVPGHGDGVNAGFIRPDSALALMLVTDEEDCSVPDYSIFYRDPRFTSFGLNLRCFAFAGDWLYPVERYVDGFLQLRENPAHLVYAGIVGIPVELAPASELRDAELVSAYDRILAHPRMIETPDPSATPPTRLLSACATADGGEAFPGRRMVSVARGLELRGAGTTVQSICASDFRPAVNRIVALIADALDGACLPRPLNTSADGTVECEVRELLPPAGSASPITRCAELGDLAESLGVEVDEEGGTTRELCRIRQLTAGEVASGAAGWFYDTSPEVVRRCGATAPPGQRIAFVGHAPVLGTEVRLACDQNVLRGADGSGPPVAQVGSFCVPGPETPGVATADDACPAALVPSGADVDFDGSPDVLSCDALTRACQVRCATDADCATAGLRGNVCDRRPMAEVTGGPVPDGVDPAAPYAVCVNPSCGL